MARPVLQNTAAFYKAQYDVAQDHVFKGEIDEALQILWDLHTKPDLGLYRRALVNLLIACNADIRVHNCSEYAQECLELLQQLQRDGIPSNEGTLLIQNHAQETLKAIEMEEAELVKTNELTAQSKATSGTFKNLQLGEKSTTEDPIDMDDDDDEQQLPQKVLGPRAKSTSVLPGMYTDHYGHEEKQNTADVAKLAASAGKTRKTGTEPTQLPTPVPTSELGDPE